MTEIVNTRKEVHQGFLATASIVALVIAAYGVSEAKAADDDGDRPQIWLELGGQADHVSGQGNVFAPPFLAANPNSPVIWSGTTPLEAQHSPLFDFGENGKLSFEPRGTDWLFSISAQYGRAKKSKENDQQTTAIFYTIYKSGVPYNNNNPRGINKFADTKPYHSDSHLLLDFQVGKDVGLGLFGRHGSSVFSAGVRFAQYVSSSSVDMRARPDVKFKYPAIIKQFFPSRVAKWPYFHTYHATGSASRKFHGIGPSISWNASAPVAGDLHEGEIALDWGASGALLFGRQQTRVQHHGSGEYVKTQFVRTGQYFHTPSPTSGGHASDRSVVIPNVGGFAGLSYRYTNAKITLGYRADFFFGAIDGGIDARKSETLGFYGPFATISIGLGG